MKKKIVVINGSGGVGKDAFIECCSKHISVTNVSSVDKIKEAATILGWKGPAKTERDRQFLCDLKVLAIQYSDHPYEYVKKQIEEFMAGKTQLMFIHVREPEEIERLKREFNCKTLLLINTNVPEIKSKKADGRVKEYKYDFKILNCDGIDALETFAKDILELLFK